MARPDVEGAASYALTRLKRELPATLTYHSIYHTRDDVVPAVERLASRSEVLAPDMLLLRTAAYFHDLGFVVQLREHEIASVQIAAAVLPHFGYRPEQIQRIAGIILATRLPQSPTTLLEELLADADLDVLGRADFFERNAALRAEVETLEGPATDADWYRSQSHFLETHRYWTKAAQAMRTQGKEHNLATLARLIRTADNP